MSGVLFKLPNRIRNKLALGTNKIISRLYMFGMYVVTDLVTLTSKQKERDTKKWMSTTAREGVHIFVSFFDEIFFTGHLFRSDSDF